MGRAIGDAARSEARTKIDHILRDILRWERTSLMKPSSFSAKVSSVDLPKVKKRVPFDDLWVTGKTRT